MALPIDSKQPMSSCQSISCLEILFEEISEFTIVDVDFR